MAMIEGVYILENIPLLGEGKNQLMSFTGKYMKRGREKGGKCKTKRGKVEIKRKKEDRKRENRK
jgi:hypothetical protein